MRTEFQEIPILHRGKVRDIYDLDEYLLIVATDRISAFDVVLPNGIPHKGRVLNQISAHWFKTLEGIVSHHMITTQLEGFSGIPKAVANPVTRPGDDRAKRPSLCPWNASSGDTSPGRDGMNTRKKAQSAGSPCLGVERIRKLEAPLFTPSTKAEVGIHDENIDFTAMIEETGKETGRRDPFCEPPAIPESGCPGREEGNHHRRYQI